MTQETKLKIKVEIESVWATPREGMTLDELAERMKFVGNEVVEIDRANNRLKLKIKEN